MKFCCANAKQTTRETALTLSLAPVLQSHQHSTAQICTPLNNISVPSDGAIFPVFKL